MTQAYILHITQPALSKQLKYLEAEFGSNSSISSGQRDRTTTDGVKSSTKKKPNNYVLLKNLRIMWYSS